jgi:AraC-like DNA-binding protein
VSVASWRDGVEGIVAACADALDLCRSASGDGVSDIRVARMLQMIRSRSSEATISLRTIAADAGLSSGHAARLMKQVTAAGFTMHLHRIRVAEAQRLLLDASRSVKEIATTVGYGTSSQFCWHFKRLAATTPTHYRMARCLDRIAG